MQTTIRAMRRRLDMTQTQLAQALAVSLATVQRWERNEQLHKPRPVPRTALLATWALVNARERG